MIKKSVSCRFSRARVSSNPSLSSGATTRFVPPSQKAGGDSVVAARQTPVMFEAREGSALGRNRHGGCEEPSTRSEPERDSTGEANATETQPGAKRAWRAEARTTP